MGEKKLAGWAASSADQTEVSNRVRGLVLVFSSTIILLAGSLFGIELSANDVLDLAGIVGALSGVIWALYGTGLALIRWFATVTAK